MSIFIKCTIGFLFISLNSIGQKIIDPVERPYFVINRKSAYVIMPDSLGGGNTKGFAGIRLILDSKGHLIKVDFLKLKVSGKINISYQPGYAIKTAKVAKYEAFFKNYATKVKVVKTDKRKPPKVNTITFIVRF